MVPEDPKMSWLRLAELLLDDWPSEPSVLFLLQIIPIDSRNGIGPLPRLA